MNAIQTTWDDKYRSGLPTLAEPDPFFCLTYKDDISHMYPKGGSALDLAAGSGRHALLFAQLGWQVTAVDISPVALQLLEDKASAWNINIKTKVADLSDYQMPRGQFDVVVLYYHFDRGIFQRIYDTLKPGGFMIGKLAVNWSDNYGIDTPAAFALQKYEFLSLVTQFTTIKHIERPAGGRGVVEYLGRKIGNQISNIRTGYECTDVFAGADK